MDNNLNSSCCPAFVKLCADQYSLEELCRDIARTSSTVWSNDDDELNLLRRHMVAGYLMKEVRRYDVHMAYVFRSTYITTEQLQTKGIRGCRYPLTDFVFNTAGGSVRVALNSTVSNIDDGRHDHLGIWFGRHDAVESEVHTAVRRLIGTTAISDDFQYEKVQLHSIIPTYLEVLEKVELVVHVMHKLVFERRGDTEYKDVIALRKRISAKRAQCLQLNKVPPLTSLIKAALPTNVRRSLKRKYNL
jgi:hypothetical protein